MAGKTVEVLITGNASQAIHEIEKLAGTTATATETAGKKFAAFGKAVTLATGAAGLAIAAFSLKMADDFEKSHARLENAIVNIGSSMSAWQPGIDAVQSKLEKWGFTNADVQNSLSRLVPVTKSETEATNLQALAADIARARHLDLESATALLVKVQTGHVALLGRLGINTKDLTGKTIDQTTAIQRLTDMYGGAASRNAQTFGGKLETLKAQASDLGVKIGLVLIPILEKLMTAISTTIDWFEKHKTVAIALGVIIGTVLVSAITAWIAQMVIATGTSIIAFITGTGTAALTAAGEIDAATAAVAGFTVAAGTAEVAAGGTEVGLLAAGAAGVSAGAVLTGLGTIVLGAAAAYGIYSIVTAKDSAGAKAHVDEVNQLADAFRKLAPQVSTASGTATFFTSTFTKLTAEKGLSDALYHLGIGFDQVNQAASFGPAAFVHWIGTLRDSVAVGSKDWVALTNAQNDLNAGLIKSAQVLTGTSLLFGNTKDAVRGLDLQLQTLDMKGFTDHTKDGAANLELFGKQARSAAQETAIHSGSLAAGVFVLDVYKNKLIAQGEAFGLSAQKASDLAAKILGIPTDRQMQLQIIGEYAALVALNNVKAAVDAIQSNKTITVTQETILAGGNPAAGFSGAGHTYLGRDGHMHYSGDNSIVPGTATGGIVTTPQIRLVGEAGPEAIIPLSRGRGLGGITVNIYNAGSVIAANDLVDQVTEGIRTKIRRSGSQGLN